MATKVGTNTCGMIKTDYSKTSFMTRICMRQLWNTIYLLVEEDRKSELKGCS
jgi:hypothetical protein